MCSSLMLAMKFQINIDVSPNATRGTRKSQRPFHTRPSTPRTSRRGAPGGGSGGPGAGRVARVGGVEFKGADTRPNRERLFHSIRSAAADL